MPSKTHAAKLVCDTSLFEDSLDSYQQNSRQLHQDYLALHAKSTENCRWPLSKHLLTVVMAALSTALTIVSHHQDHHC